MVAWVTVDDVLPHLDPGGNVVDPADPALADDVAAANVYAWQQRHTAGYVDDPAGPVPSDRVRLGVILFAVRSYKARGAVDGFASYDGLPAGAGTGGTWGDVRRLLGIPRPRIG